MVQPILSNLKKLRGSAAVLAFIILSLALAACGFSGPSAAQTSVAQTLGPITPAVQLPPITLTVGSNASPTPEVTSTPNVVSTPAQSTSRATGSPTTAAILASTPTPTPPATATPSATATKAALTATAGPTTTPTPAGIADNIDKDAELKLVRTAYDAILRHLYRLPDTAALLQAGLDELGKVTGLAPPAIEFKTGTDSSTNEANWNLFKDAYTKTLEQAAAKGFKYPKNQLGHRLVNALAEAVKDEHTYFLDTSGYDSRQRLLQGENSSIGFGIQINSQDNKAYIIKVVPNSPADKAGLKAGDQFVRYDDTAIDGKNWQGVRNAKEDEAHNFTVARPGQASLLTISVTKKRYLIPTVEYRMINGHIGYVAIREFFTNVADETNKAMVELQKQGANSWIIDVRNDPGGVSVDQVVGRFVQGGEIMGYNNNRGRREPLKVSNDGVAKEYQGKPFMPALPLVILIDEGSASSSEILALAIHDFKLGTLIGVKTAGALGHTAAYPLGDGTAISVTVDEYESKEGTKVNGIGVSPDIEVKRSIDDLVTGKDPQLIAGIEQLEKALAKK